MSTLYTFGCSFTNYIWPTYADILAPNFDRFENWGLSGIGNRGIAERVTEMSVKNNIQEDDLIIVQWTFPHRWDLHRWEDDLNKSTWRLAGNIHWNKGAYSDEWIKHFWNEQSYVMHTYNFIVMVQSLLSHLPCNIVMTSVDDLQGDGLKFPQLSVYIPFLNGSMWLPPIYNYTKSLDCFKTRSFDDKEAGETGVKDPHPNPLAHYEYAKKFIAEPLGLELDRKWVEQADQLLDRAKDWSDVGILLKTGVDWHNESSLIRGF